MVTQQQVKFCPRCNEPAELQDPVCHRCGRVYQTRFDSQTTVLPTPRDHSFAMRAVVVAVLVMMVMAFGALLVRGMFVLQQNDYKQSVKEMFAPFR